MKDYRPELSFTDEMFEIYGDALRGDEDEAVEFLAALAGDGPALELAIGTGRIGLPLAARGIRVHGIDISPAMVQRLHAKPGGAAIAVTMGNFADVPVEGRYRLIYIVYNTLFNLLTQEEQVRCFANVAMHLTEGGVFVVEAARPDVLYRLRNSQYVDAEHIEMHSVRLDLLKHDPATQTIEENHVLLSRDGIKFNPVMQRYAWPAEMDLMARMAGLRLIERWDGWRRMPVAASSEKIVSVWGR